MSIVTAKDCDNRLPSEEAAGKICAMKEVLEEVERNLILEALLASHGNKAKAARALGITERLMGIRVKRLGIDWRGLRMPRKRPAAHDT